MPKFLGRMTDDKLGIKQSLPASTVSVVAIYTNIFNTNLTPSATF